MLSIYEIIIFSLTTGSVISTWPSTHSSCGTPLPWPVILVCSVLGPATQIIGEVTWIAFTTCKIITLLHPLPLSWLIQQTDDMFLTFPRKKDFTFHANCLHWRQFAWNVKTCCQEKTHKTYTCRMWENVLLKYAPSKDLDMPVLCICAVWSESWLSAWKPWIFG